MIRFIDIRGQGTGSRFSFWNTIRDEYVKIGEEQAWENWKQFESDVQSWAIRDIDLARFKSLCPEWVNDGKEDSCIHDVISDEQESETKIQLVIKQYEELTNRFDVAMKALEYISNRIADHSSTLIAVDALLKINQMHKDYDDKNELR